MAPRAPPSPAYARSTPRRPPTPRSRSGIPDIAQPIDFFDGWEKVPNNIEYDNAFKIQWEEFIRHVALDEPWRYTLRESAKGVQLAELGMESWRDRKWVDVPAL